MTPLGAALVGGVIGIDATSFAQVMISRPLVAGALAGWLAGVPAEGTMLGAILESFHLSILPIGASRYPESGTATAAAVFGYAWGGVTDPGVAMLLLLTFALGWERVTGASVIAIRRVNELVVRANGGPPTPGAVELRHTLGLLVDFVRAAALTVIGAGLGALWLRLLEPAWAHGPGLARGLILVAALGAAAAALRVLGGWSARWFLFLAGAVVGLAIALT